MNNKVYKLAVISQIYFTGCVVAVESAGAVPSDFFTVIPCTGCLYSGCLGSLEQATKIPATANIKTKVNFENIVFCFLKG